MIESLFWICLLLLGYTYAGYPLLIALWARMAPRVVRAAPIGPHVAIIVVGHNEAARVRAKLETCVAQDYPADRLRVLFVSDGSTDGTDDAVRAFADPRVELLALADRRGKAACLNDAVASCDDEILVFTDARQPLNRQAVRCLVENFADPDVGAVSGELVFVDDDMSAFAEGVDAYWRYEKVIRRAEAAVHSVPGVTGALYALRRECFVPIAAGTILDDVAIPMRAAMQGRRIVFDGRAIAYDRASREAAQERARKVRTLAGNFQLLTLMPQLLLPWRNPIVLQFVSHKVLRLVAPWAMAILLACSAALAADSTFYAAALALQLLGYSMPLVGALVPRLRSQRIICAGTAFFVLNWFAVLGLIEFIGNRNAHLWRTKQAARGEPRVVEAKTK
jgi:cellulose synthase/poly-beta-1,6-N-acetylglucosamine synthase-like glycosyltransferase